MCKMTYLYFISFLLVVQLIFEIRSTPTNSFPLGLPKSTPFNLLFNRPFISPFITGVFYGGDTAELEHPFLALLLRDGVFICGGSVVGPKDVLTAAHCLSGVRPTNISVILGAHDRILLDSGHEKKFSVVKIKMHEHFKEVSEGKFENDISLLELNETIKYTRYMQPICLPITDADPEQKAVLYGWGKTEKGFSNMTPKKGTLTLLSTKECQATKLGPNFVNPLTHLCATDILVDACQGDSGGPLITHDSKGSTVLTGIVSFGVECSRRGYPGVYTNVYAFLNWIAVNTNNSTSCAR